MWRCCRQPRPMISIMGAVADRKAVLDEVADRLLAQRAEDEAAAAAEDEAAKAADDQARAAFHQYVDAREAYTLTQADLMTKLPEWAAFMEQVSEARIAQEDALRAAQKLGIEDLPSKRQSLQIQSARENRSHLATDLQQPLDSNEATDALAALARIRRMHV
jgi:hypothetical protein